MEKKKMKILTISILLTFVISSGAFAWPARWNALGGEHRFIIDTSNYPIYPGRVHQFGNALFVIPVPKGDIREFYDERYFEDNGVVSGALLNVTENMTLAFHYNLDSNGAKNLRTALAGFIPDEEELDDAERELRDQEEGTPEWNKAKGGIARINQNGRLSALDIKTFPDLFWGMKMENISLGARLAVAMDSSSDAASTIEEPIMEDKIVMARKTKAVEEITASAKALDLSLGATIYKTPVGDLDLGLCVGKQSFTGDDPNYDVKIESTGGLDIAFNARLNKQLGNEKNYTLVPLLNLNVGSFPSAKYDEVAAPNVAEVSYTKGDIGIGFRDKIKDKGTLIAGVVCGYGTTTSKPTKKEVLEETTDTTLNATVLAGYEFPITKWLIGRGGMNVKFAATTDEMVVQEITESMIVGKEPVIEEIVKNKKSTNIGYYYNMGFRAKYNGFILDVLLARNIFHRGPYFLTGASDSWATDIYVTYEF